MLKKLTVKITPLFLALSLTISGIAIGEDIEIYVNQNVTDLSEKPRALIIFDSSPWTT